MPNELKAQNIINANYYFDAVNGNDNNSGTSPAQAWKSASKFNSMNFSPGTVIAFRDSMIYKGYFELTEDGTSNNPITVTNYYGSSSGKFPYIEGAGAQRITNWTQHSSNIWRASVSGFLSMWIKINEDSIRWTIKEQSLALVDEEFECYYDNSGTIYLYSTSNPSTKYYEVIYDYGDEQSLSASCFTVNGAKYVIIENFKMGLTRGKALKFMYGSDYSKAINVTTEFSGKTATKGITSDGGDGLYVSSSNVTVERCTSYENSGHGYYVWGNSSGTIQNIVFDGCVAYNNHHTVGLDVNSSTGAIRNVIFKNGYVYTNANEGGFPFYRFYNGGKMAMGNFMKGEIGGAGLVKYVYFYNNVIRNMLGPAIQSDTKADSIFILNNTFIETDTIVANNGDLYNWVYYGGSASQGGIQFRNNIVYVHSAEPNNYIVRAYSSAYLSNNVVYREDGSNYLIYNGDPNYTPPIVGNPQFVNINGNNPSDFMIQSSSPAKDAGTDLSTYFTTDRNGVSRPQGSGWDIGAYEYFDGQASDLIPPRVISATLLDSVTLNVVFSEPLDESGAVNPANYQIDDGITVTSALLNGNVVRLQTTLHTPGFYTITVSNVTDTAGNVISPQNNSATYGYNPDPLNQLLKFIPVHTSASSIPEPEHLPEKTFDGKGYNSGDPSSRWAALGLPQWIVYDLADIKMVSKTRIQFYRWLEGRIYTYTILVSEDSVNWVPVKENIVSRGVEWNEESFEPTPGRYVKILITGNNENDWANIWETEVYGQLMISNNDDGNNTPSEFNLEQNYPNPFNPSTKISWQSPVGSWQTLKVFDILGNEVATLVDEYKEAGRYEVEFDASNLSSGVYIYRLQADKFVNTRKMILLR